MGNGIQDTWDVGYRPHVTRDINWVSRGATNAQHTTAYAVFGKYSMMQLRQHQSGSWELEYMRFGIIRFNRTPDIASKHQQTMLISQLHMQFPILVNTGKLW